MIRPGPPSPEVVPYDFRRPSRISPERHRILAASHEQLAQALQGWTSARLRTSMSCELESTGQLGYGQFVAELPPAGAHFVYDVAGRPGMVGLISVDSHLAFALIERLLGGNSPSPPPERALTPLERVVMRIVTDRVSRELSAVWKDHADLDLVWARFESAAELIEMAGRDDDVLVVRLVVRLGDGVEGRLRVALPFPVLERFFSRGTSRRLQMTEVSGEERAAERERLERFVLQASAVVSARLPSMRMPLRTLAALKVGDVLATGIDRATPVEVWVSGQRRFVAREGRVGPRVGVEITGAWRGRAHTPEMRLVDMEVTDER